MEDLSMATVTRLDNGEAPTKEGWEVNIECDFDEEEEDEDEPSGLEDLCTDLEKARTPVPIIQALQHGFAHWTSHPDSSDICSLTAGSLRGPDAVLATAFLEQVRNIGWFHLCLGRVSEKWTLATLQYNTTLSRDSGLHWIFIFIAALWRYSRMSCRFWNEVVHGNTVGEQVNLQLQSLRSTITTYFRAYLENPALVLPCHQFLFTTRTEEERLSGSYDSMVAWICSVEEAILVLRQQEAAQRAASEAFFPSHQIADNSNDDTDSTYSVFTTSTDPNLSLAPSETTVATTTTVSSVDSSTCVTLGHFYDAIDDSSSYDNSDDDNSLNSIVNFEFLPPDYSANASDVELTSVASLDLGIIPSLEAGTRNVMEACSIDTYHSISTSPTPFDTICLGDPTRSSNEIYSTQSLAEQPDCLNASLPLEGVVTSCSLINTQTCGLHPLSCDIAPSDVRDLSVASLGCIASGADVLETGNDEVESSSVASHDINFSGSDCFLSAPSSSVASNIRWSDT
jgi:hypothetical protein